MFVSRFCRVKVSKDFATDDGDVDSQKGNGCEGAIAW